MDKFGGFVRKLLVYQGEQKASQEFKFGDSSTQEDNLNPRDLPIKKNLAYNLAMVRQLYNLPLNQDIIIREFEVGTQPKIPAFAVMIDGLVNADLITDLLEDLIVFSGGEAPRKKISEYILRDLFPGQQVSLIQDFQQVLDAINFGDTVFFFAHSRQAVVVDSKGFKSRGVEKPSNEQLVMGPHEAFNEVLRVNTGLLRRIMRTKDLVTEYLKVGERINNDVVLVYLNNLVNPQLLQEVRSRLKSLKVDFIADSGMLEELIIERPLNLFPQTLSTERPDKVASCLLEGKIGILVGGSPNALIVPTTIFDQLHTGEESYLRWQYGSFIRGVRLLAFFISFLLPGLYMAIMLYHQEMLPTELLMAVAANREQVPFPTIVEILLMEISFELLREAGIRVPGLIGPTIGIIGGLILGQASVEANLVSPILVVLVAVTGLASFAIPNYSLGFALRIYRFIYLFLGAFLGFFGITVGLFIQTLAGCRLNSFGVPYFAPLAPKTRSSSDLLIRYPYYKQKARPDYLKPQDDRRLPSVVRGWRKRRD